MKIDAVIARAGGQSTLARLLGIKPQSIQCWTRVPATRVVEVEEITGIPRSTLRPDIFRAKPAQRSAA